MINPCPRRVLCPPGTGIDEVGPNYSSEHIDVPEFYSPYYPPTPYGYHTACMGRCISLVSQEDANLCAQRLGKICLNDSLANGPGGNPKQTYGNTPQICTEPGTGRLVYVPADVFYADSVEEANAQALSYANNAQKNPETPPGPTTVPPPGDNIPTVVNVIPTPTKQPTKPPVPPPASQCKPCNDAAAVSSFSVVFDLPANAVYRLYESPPLKCGTWRFEIVTNNGGLAGGADQSFLTAYLAAGDPARTLVDWGTLFNCPQMAWIMPCGHGVFCDPQIVRQFGIWPGCCDTQYYDCQYIECQTLMDGSNWLCTLQMAYVCIYGIYAPAKKFTVNGTLLSPLPTPP